jgi:hypothetical protein
MKKLTNIVSVIFSLLIFISCTEKTTKTQVEEQPFYGGFESMEQWGEHLVTIADCNACHTPKKMTSHGPVLDSTRLLSGHPAAMPKIDSYSDDFAMKGLTLTMDLTEWIGPWGTSYAANLTPDETGTGNWTAEQFMYAIRNGKFKGLPGSRPLLPPMPWETYKFMTDGEIKAIFAYLRTVKPIQNIVPSAILREMK